MFHPGSDDRKWVPPKQRPSKHRNAKVTKGRKKMQAKFNKDNKGKWQ